MFLIIFFQHVFSTKNILNEDLKNGCKAKKTQGSYYWAQKNLNQKKSNLKVWHLYRKNSFNHTSETQKSVFFQFRILRSVTTCSLPTANFSLDWPNFCTPYNVCIMYISIRSVNPFRTELKLHFIIPRYAIIIE